MTLSKLSSIRLTVFVASFDSSTSTGTSESFVLILNDTFSNRSLIRLSIDK